MSAKIIALYNQKGGCGKSMTTMQLAGSLGLVGLRVWVVDMDPQGTSVIWFSNAKPDMPFPALVSNLAPLKAQFIKEVEKAYESYDVILIDCPPAIESSIPWAALNIADIAIIPTSPVLDNVWATREARELFIRAKGNKPDLRAFYLPSLVTRGRVFDQCRAILDADPDVPMLQSQLSRRNAFPESQAFGTVVGMIDAKSMASQEVERLRSEILRLLDIKAPVKRSKKTK